MTDETSSDAVDALFALAAASDASGAIAQTRGLLAHGWSVEDVVTRVVVPVQERVGALWEADDWTVGQEHAATAVVDAVVGWLLEAARGHGPVRGHVGVVCVEGEWHALPARLATVGLRSRGWAVTLLGGSVPAPHLERTAAERNWDGVVVSCSVSAFLPGALRSTGALHARGLPVLAMGRGFGTDSTWSRAVGADGWAPDLEQGEQLLARWRTSPPRPLATATADREALDLEATIGGLMAEVVQAFSEGSDGLSVDQETAREAVQLLLRFLVAAVLTGDERLLADQADWVRRFLSRRGTSGDAVGAMLRAIQADLSPRMRAAHDLLLAVGRGQVAP